MSDGISVSDSLIAGKELNRRLGGPHSRSGRFGEGLNFVKLLPSIFLETVFLGPIPILQYEFHVHKYTVYSTHCKTCGCYYRKVSRT